MIQTGLCNHRSPQSRGKTEEQREGQAFEKDAAHHCGS